MKKILFLVIGFEKPSTKKRVLDSLEYLRSRGHKVDAAEFAKGAPGRLMQLGSLSGYDLVVIQKKLLSPAQIKLMRSANRNLVFDFDDAVMFHEVERNEPMTGKFFVRFAHTVSSCRGVVAGNRYLAEFAAAARTGGMVDDGVVVLPTPVDTDGISPKKYTKAGRLVVGWIGTKGNMNGLLHIRGQLAELFRRFPDACLRVVSDVKPDMQGIPLEYKPWRKEDEADDLRGFDIGVMPLDDNIWTRGKGGFKLLQYMAAGVPAVASPVGINKDIIRHGVDGFLAQDDDGWFHSLTTLAGDPALRERVGMAGRKTVEGQYSLNRYNERLAQFLERFL